jgi:hypothetical protein
LVILWLTVTALVLVIAGAWIAAVIFVYMDASRRSISSLRMWVFGTLVFGPVGLIAYLVDRPKSKRVICHFCKRTILESDAVCPYCGRTLH